jgi:anaerobic magnesium-protoporphyrin IX monomethyl ester cyclase
MFYDDEMNVNKQFVQLLNKICDLQAELGVEFRLRGFIKAELFNEEQAEAMARAGFRWVLCGFEGGKPENSGKHRQDCHG